MTRVKIIAVSDPSKAGTNAGAGSPPYCTDPSYIGRVGERWGAIREWPSNIILYQEVYFEDSTKWLFTPDQLQEVVG